MYFDIPNMVAEFEDHVQISYFDLSTNDFSLHEIKLKSDLSSDELLMYYGEA
jgi:hypothetical protein